MADINVERRQRSIWPWLLGLVVLALVVWLLTFVFGRGDDATIGSDAGTETVQTPAGS
ncbi:MAG TPA: hypothetical protein VHG28_10305 [Longimicrobiaceae bacterium]|nr:hypothetical protein [Longimicrobiaceae bacterium]